jgi:4-amino-4-deoxy-L-arabinose transferase-like glycosyltransferase
MKKATLPIAIFILSFVVLSVNNGGLMIYALDEAKNAGAAREMLEQESWIVPTFNYELRTDKPPLHYYFMMATYKVFGVSPWSARLFSSIMGALSILISFLFASRFAGKQVGVFSAFILLASLHWNIQHHMAVPDPYLIFFFSASLFSFFTFYKTGQKAYLWLFYLAIGLATLSKGPVAIALPGLIILLFLIADRSLTFKTLQSFRIPQGAFMVLLVAVPWYWAVHEATDGTWTEEFFFKHNVNRFSEPMEGHGGFFLITPLMVLVGMLPFSVFIVQAIRMAHTQWKRPEVKFLSITVLSIVGFFSISGTKLPNYTVPAYPFLAILLGYYIDYACQSARLSKVPAWVLFIITLCLPPAAYLALSGDPHLKSTAQVAFWLLPLPIGSLFALIYQQKKNVRASVSSIILAWVITGISFFSFAYPVLDRENPVAKILPKLDQNIDFFHYKRFNAAFSFYLAKPIPQLVTTEEVASRMAEGKAFYLISRRRYDEELDDFVELKKIAEEKDVYEIPYTTLYQYQPQNPKK